MSVNVDRLYELMPVIYRIRDAERGYPLKALLRVIGEQVDVVEEDIRQLYDNWFIETAADWVVPYIADLLGYRPVHEAGEPGDPRSAEGAARNSILVPRREVANTIRYRRRRGTLLILQDLARDVADWAARPVEFYRLLDWTQNLDHLHLDRGRTVDVRDNGALYSIGGPFESEAHTVDTRRIDGPRPRGRYNIPSVGLFVWRLKTYGVTRSPAANMEQVHPWCYTFSALGQDCPLYINPASGPEPQHILGPLDVPGPIRRYPFEHDLDDYYGPGKSVEIWADWGIYTSAQSIPASAIIAADLTDWTYVPRRNFVAVDPERGRIAFPSSQLPRRVRVHYNYAFSADIGGGEYNRPMLQHRQARVYRVGENETLHRINDALDAWHSDRQNAQSDEEKAAAAHAVIEITDGNIYTEKLDIALDPGTSLQLRAANRRRPIIRLLDWQSDAPDALTVELSAGSQVTFDGLLFTGRSIQVSSAQGQEGVDRGEAICSSGLTIRHCTLVPGWILNNDCSPHRPAEPSLELFGLQARVAIEHSILGPIDVNEDEVREEPIPITITDSVVDSKARNKSAIGAPELGPAHALLTIRRCTVFGIVDVFAVPLAENSIFHDCVNVKRRQIGCVRFCYVPPGCRTPRRYHCQPDLAQQAAEDELRAAGITDGAGIEKARQRARTRVRPELSSTLYGTPTYCRLAETCCDEIVRGADDEAEMGVFHDLFQPQRMANLRARVGEYTPAGMQAGIILVN